MQKIKGKRRMTDVKDAKKERNETLRSPYVGLLSEEMLFINTLLPVI